ncbi:putative phosphatidylglycerol/phosphatidylinositol transfer protein [Cocos nucifera]|uniref:Putative phosphatidylglycerol/phosphatidylinositol transfer protein n=1 Tax=Cocos nucifera TaxID=13894 RepID=A0A8K0I267_COCNU|nr:putative phosphatidylglycerol/phosphatidylinositol transfer protein [Cocos nucifera]
MEGCGIRQGGFHFSLVVAAACLLLLPPTAHANPEAVEYCDKKAGYAVKVTRVEITPDPVVRGKPATFRISATTGVSISKGKLVLDVKYFGMHIHKETHDLCKETSCPVSIGDFMLSHDEIFHHMLRR